MAASSGSAILFGGAVPTAADAEDTWAWDGSSWSALAATGPGTSAGAEAAGLGNAIVLYDGSEMTWAWQAAAWTAVATNGPQALEYAAMATLNDTVVLFGGEGASSNGEYGTFADTWTWNGTTWTAQNVAGPSARSGASVATLGSTVVLFGGRDSGGTPLDDTWTWDGTSWTQQMVSGPRARFYASMSGP
jgi:hypothetical protein